MTRTIFFSVLVAAMAAGCSTQPQTPEARVAAAESAKAAALKEQCAQDTGSRIKRPPGEASCMQPGTTYSKEDLDRTGAISPGEALKELDPRL